MLALLARMWWWVALRGVVAVLFGVLAFAWPGATLAALVLAAGLYAFADGLTAIAISFERHRHGQPWRLSTLRGLLGVLFGLIVLAAPDRSAMTLWYLLAGWALVTGAMEIAGAFWAESSLGGTLLTGVGLTSLLCGSLMLLWPESTAITLAWMIGGYALVSGVCFVAFALQLHRLVRLQPDGPLEMSVGW